jgi:AcrR family transcriptional regulator
MADVDQGLPVTPKGRRTREALLDAGIAVAEESGIAALSVAAVTAQAGVAKGTFYVYFEDRAAFIDALHQRFYSQVNDAVAAAVEGLLPGGELLLAATDAYLDVCLENGGVKALVFETRAQSELTTTMEEREERFAALSRPSLKAIGMASPTVSARLFVAMTSEAALIEMEAGRRVKAARDTLHAFVQAPGA